MLIRRSVLELEWQLSCQKVWLSGLIVIIFFIVFILFFVVLVEKLFVELRHFASLLLPGGQEVVDEEIVGGLGIEVEAQTEVVDVHLAGHTYQVDRPEHLGQVLDDVCQLVAFLLFLGFMSAPLGVMTGILSVEAGSSGAPTADVHELNEGA